MAELTIGPMDERHARGVLAVYQAGIDTGNATFEETVPSWLVFSSKWRPDLRPVAIDEVGTVVGWAAAGAVSDRIVYSGLPSTASTSTRRTRVAVWGVVF